MSTTPMNHSNLSAINSVRGYLYQFAKVIEILLNGDIDDVVYVETGDDIAIEKSDGGYQLVQVKHRRRSFSILSEPGLKLLEYWLSIDKEPYPTFAFISTQDTVQNFASATTDDIREALKRKLTEFECFPLLSGTLSSVARFNGFWGRIRWFVGEPDFDAVMKTLEEVARARFGEGSETRLLSWLAAVALSAVDQGGDERRRWTRKRLLEVDDRAHRTLTEALARLREADLAVRITALATGGREIEALERARELGSCSRVPSCAALRGVASAVLAAHRSFPLRHPGEWCVSDAVFSHDGSRVITACFDKIVRVWSTSSRALLAELGGHREFVFELTRSPDGRIIAATVDDGTVALWDIVALRRKTTLEPVLQSRGRPRNVTFSADGKILLTVSAGAAHLWDIGSGEVCHTIEDDVVAASLSPRGALITLHRYGILRIHDAATRAVLAEVAQPADSTAGLAMSGDGQFVFSWNGKDAWLRDQAGVAHAHLALPSPVRAGIFSPSDSRCLLVAGGDGMARLFDTNSGALISPLHGHSWPVVGGSFSHDGGLVVTAGHDGTARIFRTRDGSPLGVLEGHKKDVFAARFAPDGNSVLTASDDGDARLWAMPGDGLVNLRGHQGPVDSCFPSKDGTRVLTGCADGAARLFAVNSGTLLKRIDAASGGVYACFIRNESCVATTDYRGPARVWFAEDPALRVELEADASTIHPSPSGKLLAIVSARQRISLWDVESLVCVSRIDGFCDEPHTQVQCLAFAPGESSLVIGLSDGSIIEWSRLASSNYRKWAANTGGNKAVTTVTYSPSGDRFVSIGDDDVIRIWYQGDRIPARTLSGHSGMITTACFSPDGGTLLTGSRDSTARLWDVNGDAETKVLSGHLDQIDIATFSPDGRYVLTGSMDSSLRLWDVAAGEAVATFPHRGKIVDARFFSDGSHVVSGDYDGSVQINPASLDQFGLLAEEMLKGASIGQVERRL